MTRYEPRLNNHYNKPDPTPAYLDRASAQAWCNLRNATMEGAGGRELNRLREQLDEIRRT